MKRFCKMAILALVICLCGYGNTKAGCIQMDDVTVVGTGFNAAVTIAPGGAELKPVPMYVGVVGDGFVIQYWGQMYFLPEGQVLKLDGTRSYQLAIARAFQTDRGLVVGRSQYLYINNGATPTPDDTLPLPVVSGIYGWTVAPKITANFAAGNLNVSFYIYEGPPVICDYFEVVFSGAPHSGTPVMYNWFPSNSGNVSIPEGNYAYATAYGYISDVNNNCRVIISDSTTLGFVK